MIDMSLEESNHNVVEKDEKVLDEQVLDATDKNIRNEDGDKDIRNEDDDKDTRNDDEDKDTRNEDEDKDTRNASDLYIHNCPMHIHHKNNESICLDDAPCICLDKMHYLYQLYMCFVNISNYLNLVYFGVRAYS